ncbi:MAG: DUF4423 domain-containing protein [Bdellovibrionota bacterium]
MTDKSLVYDHLDYRAYITMVSRKKRISFKHIAKRCGIHASYFSRVMVNKAHFSQEQLFGIGNFFELREEQLRYLLLMGQHDSSGNDSHRVYLKNNLLSIQAKRQQVAEKLKDASHIRADSKEIDEYYRETVTAKIHMYLTINKYRLSPQLIAKKLHLSASKLEQELKKLEKLGLITIKDNTISMLHKSIHLEEHHPASPSNHINWRLEAVHNLARRESVLSDYHFSGAFSADEDTKLQIKQMLKDVLVKIQALVAKNHEPESVYAIGFDLY